VQWRAPVEGLSGGGEGVEGGVQEYGIAYSTDKERTWEVVMVPVNTYSDPSDPPSPPSPPGLYTHRLEGLPRTTYAFRLACGGPRDFSLLTPDPALPPLTVTTLTAAPERPPGLSLVAFSTSSVTLRWLEPHSWGRGEPAHYSFVASNEQRLPTEAQGVTLLSQHCHTTVTLLLLHYKTTVRPLCGHCTTTVTSLFHHCNTTVTQPKHPCNIRSTSLRKGWLRCWRGRRRGSCKQL
jgi:hypothetical protein